MTTLTQPGILHSHRWRYTPHGPKGQRKVKERWEALARAGVQVSRVASLTRESSGTALLRKLTNLTGTQKPPIRFTYLTDRHTEEGEKGPPADPLSTLAGVGQPQPCGLQPGTVKPLLRHALRLLGHAQPSNAASGLGLQPHPWRSAPPPQPLEALLALHGLSSHRSRSALWARL